MPRTRFRKSTIIGLFLITLPLVLACNISALEWPLWNEGMALLEGYDSVEHKDYSECVDELVSKIISGSDYVEATEKIKKGCSEKHNYSLEDDDGNLADPPDDAEYQSTLLIQSINTSKSDCEILEGIVGGTQEYCIRSVEIIIKYETTVVPATVECIKNLFDEQFSKEESVDETSGTVTFSFSTTEEWSEIEPGRLDPGTFCYLRMDDGTNLVVTNEQRYAETPIDEPALP